jgi:hypothetical protein
MTLDKINQDGLLHIAQNMRIRDREEIFCTVGATVNGFVDNLYEMRDTGVSGMACADDGEPIAAAGAYHAWGDMYNLWFFATSRWDEVQLGVTRFIKKKALPIIFDVMGARCCQCFSLDGYEEIHRWIEILGGERDCRLTNWGKNGENFVRFVWRNPNQK